jgi:hypothetical protein
VEVPELALQEKAETAEPAETADQPLEITPSADKAETAEMPVQAQRPP